MGYKIGINGLGRIGRDVLRCALKRPDIEVMAVNHKSRRIQVTDTYAQSIAHMVKYDSIYGVFDQEVDSTQDAVVVNGHQIKILAEREPTRLPWKELGVDYVVESTGVLNDPAVAAGHIQAGAKKVILTGPAKGGECLTVVMGVNEEEYDPGRHHVVSNASCTTNCLAPVAKVLNEQFGIVKGLMTTVHAFTNDQQLLDMPHRDMRRGRAATLSLIPTTTGAAKAVALVLPELEGKINGFAIRVPLPAVSAVDLVVELEKTVTADDVNTALKEAAAGDLKGVLGYTELPLVSTDFKGDPHSAIVDATSTMVVGENMVKVIAWYDNEWGYAERVLDLLAYMASRGE
ncbi:MAG: type I glyceraldehyde-3-phosphate dehydrogenase [Peptococcaceae bacterium]|nr:type I glyceraldehyde-3-phosphate dehydrogenase [Peptococcaceae bacterium]